MTSKSTYTNIEQPLYVCLLQYIYLCSLRYLNVKPELANNEIYYRKGLVSFKTAEEDTIDQQNGKLKVNLLLKLAQYCKSKNVISLLKLKLLK